MKQFNFNSEFATTLQLFSYSLMFALYDAFEMLCETLVMQEIYERANLISTGHPFTLANLLFYAFFVSCGSNEIGLGGF